MAPSQSRRRGPKPFQPAVGQDFGAIEEVEARTRGYLARLIASAAAAALGVTGAKSLADGTYTAVVGCWAVAGPIVGALVSYYFGHRRKDTA